MIDPMRSSRGTWTLLAALAFVGAGCGAPDGVDPEGEIPFTPSRPSLDLGALPAVAPYTGTDPYVVDAQATYRTGIDVQRKLILRTCGPTNGVCHNQKEYPDMHTEATFTATIAAPCNVQPGSFNSVFDRCERLGDRFKFRDASWAPIEVGYLDYVQGEYYDYSERDERPGDDAAGLHLMLHDPVPGTQDSVWLTGVFIRTFINDQGNVEELPFASYQTRFWVYDDRRHLMAEVRDERQREAVERLMAGAIVQGDQNRNGIYGARQGNSVTMLNPGKPEQSYLIARLRSQMDGTRVLGSRMPLANQPPSVADMLALMCFIEQLPPAGPWSLERSIDYNACSYTPNPAQLSLSGSGASWSQRIWPLLSANCGGCHGGETPEEGLDLNGPNAYENLMKLSVQLPDLKLVDPGKPEQSYLWRKIAGDGTIKGSRMPYDPFLGVGKLAPEEIDDITNWILDGAPKN